MEKNGEENIMLEEFTDGTFYSWEYTKPIDDKRRLTIPAKWRLEGDEVANSYLAVPMKNGCISVLPPDMVKDLRRKIAKIGLSNPKRGAIMEFIRRTDSFGCDKQGRIILNETLIKHAGLKNDALLIGGGTTFEIWNPERRRQWVEKNAIVADESVLSDFEI